MRLSGRILDPKAILEAQRPFLAGLLAGKLARERRVVIDRIAFGQRNFAGAADGEMQDVLVALRAYGRFPAAMLTIFSGIMFGVLCSMLHRRDERVAEARALVPATVES